MIHGVFRPSVDEEIVGDRIDARHLQRAADERPAAFKLQRQDVAATAILKVGRRCYYDAWFFVVERDDTGAQEVVADDAGGSFALVNIVHYVKVNAIKANVTDLKRDILN